MRTWSIAGLEQAAGQRDSALSCLRAALRLYERLDEPVNKASALGMMTEAFLELERLIPWTIIPVLGEAGDQRARWNADAHAHAPVPPRGTVYLQQGRCTGGLGAVGARRFDMATAMDDHRQRYFIGRHRAIGHAMRGDVSVRTSCSIARWMN